MPSALNVPLANPTAVPSFFSILFILISKNDLGVTTLKKDPEAHTTLIGSVAKGIPGTDILETGKVQITKDSTENAVHNS